VKLSFSGVKVSISRVKVSILRVKVSILWVKVSISGVKVGVRVNFSMCFRVEKARKARAVVRFPARFVGLCFQ